MRVWQVWTLRLWHMPHHQPGTSVALTSLYAVVLLLGGIAAAVASAGVGEAPVAGLLLTVAALALLALVAHAVRDTRWFQRWDDQPNEDQRSPLDLQRRVSGHGLVRWIGPLGLVTAFLGSFLFLGVAVLFFNIFDWVMREFAHD